MNETLKDITIKLLLTIPAIIVGIFSAIIFVFKPTITLWSRNKQHLTPPLPKTPEDKIENHTFG